MNPDKRFQLVCRGHIVDSEDELEVAESNLAHRKEFGCTAVEAEARAERIASRSQDPEDHEVILARLLEQLREETKFDERRISRFRKDDPWTIVDAMTNEIVFPASLQE